MELIGFFHSVMDDFRKYIIFGGKGGEGGDRATLHEPTISLSGTVITITNPSENGDFVTGYAIYANGEKIAETTSTTYDLAGTQGLPTGENSFTVRCYGIGMNDSPDSNAVTATVANYLIDADGAYILDADEKYILGA